MKIRSYHGEELEVTPGLTVVEYEDGFLQGVVTTFHTESGAVTLVKQLNERQKNMGFINSKIRFSVFRG